MCGIVGAVDLGATELAVLVAAMGDTLTCLGPADAASGSGTITVSRWGHRSLAIIDQSVGRTMRRSDRRANPTRA